MAAHILWESPVLIMGHFREWMGLLAQYACRYTDDSNEKCSL